MRATSHFVVCPKTELNNYLLNADDTNKQILCEPFICTMPTGGRTEWMRPDYLELLKVFYLTYVITEYLNSPDPDLGQIVSSLVGSPPWSSSIFDKWWFVQEAHFWGDLGMANIEDRIAITQQITSHSENVTEWIKIHSKDGK